MRSDHGDQPDRVNKTTTPCMVSDGGFGSYKIACTAVGGMLEIVCISL